MFPLQFPFGEGKPREDANIAVSFYNLSRLPKQGAYTSQGAVGLSFWDLARNLRGHTRRRSELFSPPFIAGKTSVSFKQTKRSRGVYQFRRSPVSRMSRQRCRVGSPSALSLLTEQDCPLTSDLHRGPCLPCANTPPPPHHVLTL